jgi:hypothetical protein
MRSLQKARARARASAVAQSAQTFSVAADSIAPLICWDLSVVVVNIGVTFRTCL